MANKYRIQTTTGYEETLIQPTSGTYETVEFDPNGGEAQRLLAEKQSLLNQIPQLQYKICANKSDLWAIKFQDSEYDDDLTAQQKQDNKAFNKKVITWRKTVRAQNNNITTANTKEEIQARIDRLNALEASYPEV